MKTDKSEPDFWERKSRLGSSTVSLPQPQFPGMLVVVRIISVMSIFLDQFRST